MCGLIVTENSTKNMTETTMNVNPRDKCFGITPLTGHDEAIKKIKEKIALQKDYIDLPFQTSKESRAVCDGLYEFIMNITRFSDE